MEVSQLDMYSRRRPSSRYRGFNIAVTTDVGTVEYFMHMAITKFNANLFRLQITDPAMEGVDLNTYMEWVDSLFPTIDKTIEVANVRGAKIILALHTAPGGVKTNIFGRQKHRVFTNSDYEHAFYEVWKMISSRYKNTPEILGYDLLNEPRVRGFSKLAPIYAAAGKIIRKRDRYTKLIFSPPFGNPTKIHGFERYMPELNDLGKNRNWYTVHMYWPMKITHQGIPDANCEFPYSDGSDTYPSVGLTKMKMRGILKRARAFQLKHDVQIYVGEYSCARWSGYPRNENRIRWLTDAISLFEEYKWRHTYHAFGAGAMWDLEGPFRYCDNVCQPHCSHENVWGEAAEVVRTYFSRNLGER